MSATRPAMARSMNPTMNRLVEVLAAAERTKADPEVIEGLKTAMHYEDLRTQYTDSLTSDESAIRQKVKETTMTHPWAELKEQGKTSWNLTPRMLSGNLEGQFLKSLMSAQRARRVLDVGMYTGYSALSMAEALPADGELITLEKEPYLQTHNQPVFDSVPHGKKITIKMGSALESMKDLLKEGKKFDFIFLDASKQEYKDYLRMCFDEGLLAENGTIAVDNAYRAGSNYLPSDDPPDASRLFGDYVKKLDNVHKVLVPIRDGILVIRRLNEVERDFSQ